MIDSASLWQAPSARDVADGGAGDPRCPAELLDNPEEPR